jgi:LuxR family transcriptional regulator
VCDVETLAPVQQPRTETGTKREVGTKVTRKLTERECQILRWTALGKTSGEIATILGIATSTVSFHMAKILMKLDAVNKTHAVVKAVIRDLLNWQDEA